MSDKPKIVFDGFSEEQEQALRERIARKSFECDPDESGGYDTSDPKHPRYHSTHVDIWDAREGK